MNSSKTYAFLFISLFSLSTVSPLLHPQCAYCNHPHPHPRPRPRPRPPIVRRPPITIPKVPVPPVTGPPIGTRCPPPPPATAICPIDTLKLGACVDLLGGLVHIGLGDPAANECCPMIGGLVAIEAAVCLCTTLKIKALNLNIYIPLALQLLLTCGKPPPPGYTCTF